MAQIHKKMLLFRSTPESGVDTIVLGSIDDEKYNEKIIEEYSSKGFEFHDYMVQTKAERVRQARICIAIWATAYEFLNQSLVSDMIYDETCQEVERDLALDTGNKKLDKWYKENFKAYTGQWIHNHPDLERLKQKAMALLERNK